MEKTAIIALALIGALTAGYMLFGRQPTPAGPTTDALKDIYNQWKLNYKINVGAAEDSVRFGIFSTNYAKITEHNKLLGRSYNKGLNAFTHLTKEEFAATHFGYKAAAAPKNTVKLPLKNLKTTVDWSDRMVDVKDQGQCGSCWAFSTVGAIEGAWAANGTPKLSLSEQELVDCSGSFGNQGCNGGLMDQGFQYVVSVGGLATEKDYPYTATDGDCQTVSKREGKIASFVDVAQNSSEALKAALAKQPVAVAIEADTDVFQQYSDGIINDDGCGTELDHGVTAVGYSDEGQTPYFKVRNSWGASWGEKGYFRVAIVDGPGMCGIQMSASYPTL